MSEPICDFTYPLKDTLHLDAPKNHNGIVVVWGDFTEFVPDSDLEDDE
jgi:hypothetical protein